MKETGVGRSNFKFGVLLFPDASVDSPAKFEICTPDPNVATPLLLATRSVQVTQPSMIQGNPDFRHSRTGFQQQSPAFHFSAPHFSAIISSNAGFLAEKWGAEKWDQSLKNFF
jgi:hypothetical protein